MPGGSSIDAVTAAVGAESIDFGELSSPDGAVTLLVAELEASNRDASTLLRRLAEEHDGRLVKAEGHACMCSFASVHAGLRCATELQKALRGALRIGLHAGFVMAEASDFYGRNVVLAGRIADHAQAGEILVSRAVTEYTASDPSFAFEARGEQHFKGLLGEHAVFALDWS